MAGLIALSIRYLLVKTTEKGGASLLDYFLSVKKITSRDLLYRKTELA